MIAQKLENREKVKIKNKIILVDVQDEKEPYFEIPLGFLSIGTILKKNGFDVIVTKITKDNPEKIENYIDDNVLCIGLGVKTFYVETALIISKYIKNFSNNIKIVWGGVHVNLYPQQVLENKNIDIVVIGDGEYTLLDIVRALQKNKSLKNIRGCGYKNNRKIIFNKRREFTDISKLPKTDYSILHEIEKYIEDSKRVNSVMNIITKATAFFPILSGVGCPFNCAFCYNTTQKGRISKRDVNVMLDEIEELQKKYNINKFAIIDELFFYDKKRVEEFIKEKRKRKLKFMWDVTAHINLLKGDTLYSDDFLKELIGEGLACVGCGVESGSIPQINRYRKNITPEDVIKVVERLNRLKLHASYLFMIGAPHETYDDMIASLKLIYKIKSISSKYAFIWNMELFRPYPGADLYQEAIKLGYKEKKSLEEWRCVNKISGYHSSYKELPYLKDVLPKIYNISYYLRFIKYLFRTDNKYLITILKNKFVFKFMTNKITIESIGHILKSIFENELFDKYITRKILGRSLKYIT